MAVYTGIVAAAAFGLLAGLAWPRFRYGPFIASALIVVGYLIVLAVAAAWSASCLGCEAVFLGYDYTRSEDMFLAFQWGGIIAAGIITITWLGAGISTLIALLGGRRQHI